MPTFTIEGNRLQVEGVLDINAEDEFRDRCTELQATDADLLEMDLTGVDSISSGCVGILVSVLYHQVSRKRHMKLSASPPVQKVLDLTGVSAVVERASEDQGAES